MDVAPPTITQLRNLSRIYRRPISLFLLRQPPGEALAAASAALVEFERAGDGAPAERRRLEKALADAKITAAEPWAERAEGAKRRARDADQAVRVFIAANLAELVAVHEMEGAAAATRLNAAAEELIAAYHEREAIARQISALVGQSGGIRPGDVSGSDADELVARSAATDPERRRGRADAAA